MTYVRINSVSNQDQTARRERSLDPSLSLILILNQKVNLNR
jgi:hypothetical protein